MKNKAINALIEMGMPANIKGFDYIVQIMCLFEKDDSWRTGKTIALYEEIAKMNGTTMSRTERAIRHAFSIIIAGGYLKAVEKYLTIQKTTNGNLLTVFYLRLTQED